jgi:glycosyltransferase involved in cell wall biosynthesis
MEPIESIFASYSVKTLKVAICGTVRNCAPHLEAVIENMLAIGSLFTDFRIIISYDISSDDSLAVLQKLRDQINSEYGPDKFILNVNTDLLHEYRVYNIVKARNACLNVIREKFSDYEYFIMMDCDNVCAEKVNLDVLARYLDYSDSSFIDKWDALSFISRPYYDVWAFSKYPYCYGCMHFKDWHAWGSFIEKIILETPPGELIPCLSAFNGFAIYKTSKFINCVYEGIPRFDLIPSHLLKINEQIAGPIWLKGKAALIDCEHRGFHLQAITRFKAKIMIANCLLFPHLKVEPKVLTK